MGRRRKKQSDLEEAIEDTNGSGHNSDLSEDERHALHLRHCRDYEEVLASKKKADAAMKNCGKRIKAEDDSVTKVKKTLRSRTPEGEAELRAEIEETAEVLRWAGTRVGDSKDLFPEGSADLDATAFATGKRDGLDGKPCKPRDEYAQPQREAYMNGWRVGQDALMSAFRKKPEPTEDTPAETQHADTSDPPFMAGPDADMPAAPAAPVS